MYKLTASRTRASVASSLGELVATLAKVVGAAVNDNSTADDAVRADELDQAVRDSALCIARAVRLDIAQVANVTLLVRRSTVGLAEWVDYPAEQCQPFWLQLMSCQNIHLTVWSGRGAAVGVVTESMHVHSSLSIGVVASDVVGDGRWFRLR
jgi:hypothetical protein